MSLDPVADFRRSLSPGRLRALVPLVLILGTSGVGCFRATGLSRPDVAVEQIPAAGGDRIAGLKATAGPGDFFLGNDYVQLAVDGAAFGVREGQFGAPSGGAVLDVGTVSLDQSFHRVSMPSDMLERMGPVADQDPELPLVFDRFSPGKGPNSVFLDMQGYLLDPTGKLNVPTDSLGRVIGVTAVHRITLNKSDSFFTLETTLTPAANAALPVSSVGDYLTQHGGGYRFVIPAVATSAGTPLPANSWGVDIPGTDFTNPMASSVQASMVGLMGAESAGSTFDNHASLGLLPLEVNQQPVAFALVASDAQAGLTENRPVVPARLVVGCLPAVVGPGASLTYRRRLYPVGGASNSSNLPAQTTTNFSLMAKDRALIYNGQVGFLAYNSFGTAVRNGPFQTEFRFERYKGSNAPKPDLAAYQDDANWLVERVEWREPADIGSFNNSQGMYLPVVPNNNPAFPTGSTCAYRLSSRNATQSAQPLYLGTNILDTTRSMLATDITPSPTQIWQVAEALSPERSDVLNSAGNIVKRLQAAHQFTARQAGTLETAGLNPLRITFVGRDVADKDPNVQRTRQVTSTFSPIMKAKVQQGINFGAYQYMAGNQVFGTGFGSLTSAAFMYFAPGNYIAHATRGPLSHVESLPVNAFEGQTDIVHNFIVTKPTLPGNWTSFDLPGPTQATTGGLNPGEMLSSAVAEGVQVVARTEKDMLTDPAALQAEFRADIDIIQLSDLQRAPLGNDPFVVGARSAALDDGFTTALFVPAPTTDRNGGARPSKGWSLADFITQAEGAYTVVHQPRGATGLFTVRGFDRTVPLGTGVNAWWTQTGSASLGTPNGRFDALELLRAEGCNPADPTLWYAEFGQVRDDWFAILNQQAPGTPFTKGLGLSAARFSLDTPVGLARTYLNLGAGATTLSQADLSSVLAALKSGAAVASTGPLLEVSINGIGPGGLVPGANPSVLLTINLYAPDWVPVDEIRVVVNGGTKPVALPIQVPLASFTASTTDFRLRTASVTVPLPTGTGKDAWLVVEAGVARAQTGAYRVGTPWNKIMRGIYPIAITNPIFVKVEGPGAGYAPPGL